MGRDGGSALSDLYRSAAALHPAILAAKEPTTGQMDVERTEDPLANRIGSTGYKGDADMPPRSKQRGMMVEGQGNKQDDVPPFSSRRN